MTEERQSPDSPNHPSDPPGSPSARPSARIESMVPPPVVDLPTVRSSQLWNKKIRVLEQIDRGGMSYIVRGTDTTLHRDLALKVSPVPRNQMPVSVLARFIQEAQVTAQLEHPNVVPVHELGLDPEGRAYFSMKLVRGRSLHEILYARRDGDIKTLSEFGLRRLLDVFLHVCQAIEYAHARGVVHRDLKPANIMVGDFGEVLVMDWGVAKLLGRSTQATESVATEVANALGAASGTSVPPPRHSSIPPAAQPGVVSFRSGKDVLATQAGVLVGTPAYMSPEQARGEAVDERADLYSLGVILYEILCDALPFDDEDPVHILTRIMNEAPRRPSEINRAVPLALETLALRLLEKSPERRALTIAQVRAHVQDYIEGIGRDYQRISVWTNVLWTVGGLFLFAFLVWYLTGQSISALFLLTPATVFNALGWFWFILALGCPLWSVYLALRMRRDRDRFSESTDDEQFVSGYLARRTFATALAPVFQLGFIVRIAVLAIARTHRGDGGTVEYVQRIVTEARAEWAQSLFVIVTFLFAYLFFLSTEVRFARQIDRYDALVARPRWEAVWPFVLIGLLLVIVGTTHALDWALGGRGGISAFVYEQVRAPGLDLVEMGKTLVFQGTFLSVLVLAMVLLAFPVPEVLAALRLPYQPVDEAAVQHRAQYLVRSVAIFRIARIYWLYVGVMIGGLTAMTIVSRSAEEPLVKHVLYILGPSLIGFAGYAVTRRYLQNLLRNAPAVAGLLRRQTDRFQTELARITALRIEGAPWQHRFLQFAVPFACVALYVLWTGSGFHKRAIQELMMPGTAKEWLLILPYLLLVPLLLMRDRVQLRALRRKGRKTA